MQQPKWDDINTTSASSSSGKMLNDRTQPDNINENNSSKLKFLQLFDNGSLGNSEVHGRINSTAVPTNINLLQSQKEKTDYNTANENYVKRVMSGFLVVSNPKDRDSDEKYHRRYKNQNEEPEWFSCGPTSRLDTIELCGFDEEEEHLMRDRNDKENDEETKENRQQNGNVSKKSFRFFWLFASINGHDYIYTRIFT